MIGALVLNGDKYLGQIIGDYVVCCDGGYDKSDRCDCFVGDMDSVKAINLNCPIVDLDKMKDFTDGEVGLDLLIEKGCDSIIIYGLDGGRFDHQLMNLSLMARAVSKGVKCSAECNNFSAFMVNSNIDFMANIGALISMVPFCDDAHITYTKGLQYPLENYAMYKTSTRTISNVAVDSTISIGIEGLVLIIINK